MQCVDPGGGCAPADVLGENRLSPEAADFIRSPTFTLNQDVSQTIINASVVGDLAEVPAGDVGFALGVEHREDEYAAVPDPAIDNEDQMGLFLDAAVFGETELEEIFGEFAFRS